MRRLSSVAFLLLLLLWTWALSVYHLGTLSPPAVQDQGHATARWIDKSEIGIHQLILSGDAYGRGLKAGQLTKSLLLLQENDLTAQLFSLVPEWIFKILEVPLIRIFWGIDRYVDPWMLDEMYGVAQSAPPSYDRLIDGYTRQLAYHGLHEVGQMMVDQGGDAMGCTVVAAPLGQDWVLGRNFDFEGGRVLDREKILKWVFPDNGYAFVSVIWAGMVGGVTAVNEHGLYLSINAAGSSDRRRFGMPSTLLLVKTLMSARTADEAIAVLKSQPMFITDIFVLLDSKSGELYRIEKSPLSTEVIRLQGPSVVTNHLVAPHFSGDAINRFRKERLTSIVRAQRAEALLPTLKSAKNAPALELAVLKILRDKGEAEGKSLHLGNRAAIDPLIATHSVVFNSKAQTLYVSEGPALAGGFVGFDLKASFAQRTPIVVGRLPRDPLVSNTLFARVQGAALALVRATRGLHHQDCKMAEREFESAGQNFPTSWNYFEVAGDVASACRKDLALAKTQWQRAMELHPAYPGDRERLTAKLKGRQSP